MRYFLARVDVSKRRRLQAAMCARGVVYCRQPKFARRNIEVYGHGLRTGFMKKTTILVLRGGKEVPPLALLDGLRERENIVVGESADAFRGAAGEAEVIFN